MVHINIHYVEKFQDPKSYNTFLNYNKIKTVFMFKYPILLYF